MKLITEYLRKLNTSELPKNLKELYKGKYTKEYLRKLNTSELPKNLKELYKGKYTKDIEVIDVEDFKINLSNGIPRINYITLIEVNGKVEPVGTNWHLVESYDKDDKPCEYMNRIWLDGVEVFNMKDYDCQIYELDEGELRDLIVLKQ